jgi:hypothetical protein
MAFYNATGIPDLAMPFKNGCHGNMDIPGKARKGPEK